MYCKVFLSLFLALAWGLITVQGVNGEVQSLVRRAGRRFSNGEFTAGFMDDPETCTEGSYSGRFEGNTFRASFHRLDVTITNTVEEVIRCKFIAGALVREGDPAPAWHYETAKEIKDRRDVESGPFRIEMVEDPSIQKEYQDLVDLETGRNGSFVKRQNGLVEKVTNGIRVNFYIKNGHLGDVWRFSEFAFEFQK